MTAPRTDIRTRRSEAARSTLATAPPTRNEAAKEATRPLPADAAALLHTVAEAAAGFTELLDALRNHYPVEGLEGPHPVFAALEQAAAAAYDLCVSTRAAADIIASYPAGSGSHR